MRAKSGAFGAVLGSWVPTRPRRPVGLARFPSQGRRLRRLNSGAVAAGTGALCEPRAAPSAPCAWWGMSSGLSSLCEPSPAPSAPSYRYR